LKKIVYSLLVATLFLACSQTMYVNTSPVIPRSELREPDTVYRPAIDSPKSYDIELVWKAQYNPENDTEVDTSKETRGMSEPDSPPVLMVWAADFYETETQRDITFKSLEPQGSSLFEDRVQGNRIRFWDLSFALRETDKVHIRRRIEFTNYALKYDIRPDRIGEYGKDSGFYRFYTKSEPFINQTDAIKDTAMAIAGDLKNPYLQAKRVAEWIKSHATYTYPVEIRGATEMLNSMQGDCGQYSFLYIALCRSLGIPARLVSGFRIIDEKPGYHVWSELFFPRYGWVPVDLTASDAEFGALKNGYLVASKGMNISLPLAPEWATFENSEVQNQTTPFMQLATIVSRGFKADTETFLKIH
jgi:transglutaminase-like putative cysteine protease